MVGYSGSLLGYPFTGTHSLFYQSPCFLSVLSACCFAESDCEKQSLVAPLNSSVVVLEEAAIQ